MLRTIIIAAMALAFALPAEAKERTAYICSKKLEKPRPWVCGKYQYRCRWHVSTDGCSTPKKVTGKTLKHYNKVFDKACQKHDVCYQFGKSKKTCDSRFLRDMEASCTRKYRQGRRPSRAKYRRCISMAGLYYSEVHLRKRHKTSFRRAQKRRVVLNNKNKPDSKNCVKYRH